MAVITISRESGARGNNLGRKLADRLGYLYVDREVIHEVSLEYGIREDEFEHIYEHAPGPLERFERRNREIVRLTGQIIEGLAQRDNIVIVGRGAFAVLRDYADVLNLRVTAKRSVRVRRLQADHDLDKKQARTMLDRLDNERSKYVGAYLGLNWADAALYDLCLNTSKFDPDQLVEIVLQTLPLLKEKRDPDQAFVRDVAVNPILTSAIDEAFSLLEATGQLEHPLELATTEQLVAIIKNDPTRVAGLIDHTLLAPDTTEAQIKKLCQEALQHQFASVCINPTHVKLAAELLQDSEVKVCTVIGFPLGATTTKEKITETEQSIESGADEVDMVINIGAIKEGNDDFVKEQIAAVVATAHQHDALCKVIIETSFLTNQEKVRVCEFAKEAEANFVKTSTGFSSAGATVEDVVLMRRTVGPTLGVKASGGIRSLVDAEEMIAAGANRLGTSNGVKIMKEAQG